MTLNDLECPIHVKVRLVDGTLDVRLTFVAGFGFDHTHRCSQKEEGEWGEGPSPPTPFMWAADALFLCGS